VVSTVIDELSGIHS